MLLLRSTGRAGESHAKGSVPEVLGNIDVVAKLRSSWLGRRLGNVDGECRRSGGIVDPDVKGAHSPHVKRRCVGRYMRGLIAIEHDANMVVVGVISVLESVQLDHHAGCEFHQSAIADAAAQFPNSGCATAVGVHDEGHSVRATTDGLRYLRLHLDVNVRGCSERGYIHDGSALIGAVVRHQKIRAIQLRRAVQLEVRQQRPTLVAQVGARQRRSLTL